MTITEFETLKRSSAPLTYDYTLNDKGWYTVNINGRVIPIQLTIVEEGIPSKYYKELSFMYLIRFNGLTYGEPGAGKFIVDGESLDSMILENSHNMMFKLFDIAVDCFKNHTSLQPKEELC